MYREVVLCCDVSECFGKENTGKIGECSFCYMWLIPVLLEDHWYLLTFNWIDCELHIYDLLAMSKTPKPSLVKFGGALLNLIAEDFELEDCNWNVVPEQVNCFHCSLTRF
jgi:hypothetical protein